MPPLFSIIIPTYNRAHMLPQALQSVQDQTFPDWECIVVDDGSTDNTKEILQQWIEKDNRFRYIYQENAERSAARNNGIKNAKGKYICFLDSDDYYLKERLENLFSFINKNDNPIAMIFSGIAIEHNDKVKNINYPLVEENDKYNYIAENVIFSQQVCIHYSILKKHNYNPNFTVGEDMELWLRIVDKHKLLHLNNDCSVVVTEHENRTVNLSKHNSPAKQLKTLKYSFRKPNPGSKVSNKIKRILISNCYFNSAKHFMFSDRKINALLYIIKSFWVCPVHHQNKHKAFCITKLLIGKRPQEYK